MKNKEMLKKEVLFESANEYYSRFQECLAFVIEAEPIELQRLKQFIQEVENE